jgi:hypothetical protein
MAFQALQSEGNNANAVYSASSVGSIITSFIDRQDILLIIPDLYKILVKLVFQLFMLQILQ